MDFSLTEDQQMFQTMVRDFATKEIVPIARHIDETEEFPAECISKMGELGLFGITYPEEYGGCGGDSTLVCIAEEEIAAASAGIGAIYLASLSLACYPIYKFGNEEQRQRYVAPQARGEKLCAFGLSEPGAGSDVASMEMTAEKQGSEYVLNGTKIFITNGVEAGTTIVFATQDKSKRHKGITAFVVEKGTPGFTVPRKEDKLGIRCSSTAELCFENCRIPVENRIGEEGQGFHVALEAIDSSRVTVAAQAVGIARAAFEASLTYAKDRVQFGGPIANNQAIQWKLADMATMVNASRLMTYQAAWLKDNGMPFLKEAAMAKLFAGEAAMNITTQAIQVHGGYGYTKEYPVERFFRDAKITEIYEGTSEMQRMTIAKNLLKEAK